jgi:hypothetical protein
MWFERKTISLVIGLTLLTGGISLLFRNSVLWAPGIVIAFFLNGGGHEKHVSESSFWTVASISNLVVYWFVSWVFVRDFSGNKARESEKRISRQQLGAFYA